MSCFLLFDVLLAIFLYYNWFLSKTSDYQTAITQLVSDSSPILPGLETSQFITQLSSSGFTVTASSKVFRKNFTPKGLIVILEGSSGSSSSLSPKPTTVIDNIEVFEYPTPELASNDVVALQEAYKSTTTPIHIYSSNNLLIFYSGKVVNILTFFSTYKVII